ncbi:MAG: AAA family ATPase, partial [Candidatus Electryonea clarkiae]|nr:AAA family ATPase [Candidatus Electryonea clarkiae]
RKTNNTAETVKSLQWLKIRPARFGMLDTEIVFDPKRLTLVVGNNEAGKSTLLAALVAALYGLADKRKRIDVDPRPQGEDYSPWQGGDFSVELDLMWSNRGLTVTRDLGTRTLKVLQDGKKEITTQYLKSRNRDALGEVLTGGLSPSAFLRSFVIKQEEAKLVSRPVDLVERIQQVVTASPGDTTIRQALDILEETGRSVKIKELFKTPVKLDSILDRLVKEINFTENELEDIVRQSSENQETIKNIDKKNEVKKQLYNSIEQVKKGQLLSEEEELRERVRRSYNADAELARLEAETFKLREYKKFPLNSLHRFETAIGSYQEAQEQAEEAQKSLARLEEKYGEDRKRIKGEFVNLEDIDYSELDEILSNLKSWRELDNKYSRHSEELEKERERLVSEGIFANRLQVVKERIQQWPDSVIEKFEELKSQLDQAIQKREEVDREVAQLTPSLNRWKFRLRPKLIVIILVALLSSIGAALEWHLLKNSGLALITLLLAMVIVGVFTLIESINNKRRTRRYKTDLRRLEKEEAKGESLFNEFIESLGEDTIESVENILSDWKKLAGKGDEYFRLKALKEEAEIDLRLTGDRLQPYLESTGMLNSGETPTRGDINGLIRLLETYRIRIDELKNIKAKIENSLYNSRRASERLENPWNELKILCEEAGIPLSEEVSKAAEEFRLSAEKAKQLREVEDKLHTLQKDLHDKDSIQKAESRLEYIKTRIESLSSIEAEKGTVEDLRNREEELVVDLRDLEREIQDERLRVGASLEDIPKARNELEMKLNEYKRMRTAFNVQNDALSMAKEVMEDVEQEVFGNAANLLNTRLSPILENLSPRWSEAHFDSDLQIFATDKSTGKELHAEDLERVLSAGARDALFLGARLALSDFLAGGVIEAPYVFDEPFAHMDDERFANGMNLLTERVEDGQQVIVMSCHKKRHIDWYENLSDSLRNKINWVDLEASQR